MPTLEWIGKDKVVNHHQEIPFRVLDRRYSYDECGQRAEDNGSENMIIHGDNLEALKSLLPRYEGRINCVSIDPPYNPGNEGWAYNDNVNDPKMRKGLGEVVGKEGEDLTRHDKWLCMMYPRLKLIQSLLADNGAIFISIDDNEQANLKLLCNEIFGDRNFVFQIAWRRTDNQPNIGKVARVKEYILCFAKDVRMLTLGRLPLSEKAKNEYRYEDEKGLFRRAILLDKTRGRFHYPVQTKSGNILNGPWMKSEAEFWEMDKNNAVYWTSGGDEQPYGKIYLSESRGAIPSDFWGIEFGTNQRASNEVEKLFGKREFDFPKPVSLIENILQISTGQDAIILDSFAGSGTTAHAVLNMNKSDGGNRRFILVEMEDYADTITAERIKRVIKGYSSGKNAVEGTGGNFSFYEIGPVLLLPNGDLNETVDVRKIREYVYYMETKEPLPADAKPDEPYFLGLCRNTAYYFYYDRDNVTTLDHAFLRTIKTPADGYTIYADLCTVSPETLEMNHITFKKIPRDIARL